MADKLLAKLIYIHKKESHPHPKYYYTQICLLIIKLFLKNSFPMSLEGTMSDLII